MAYCSKCGIEKEEFGQCPNCGYQEPNQMNQVNPNDKGGFLYFLLGACIPIVGFILFFVWKDTNPKSGKAAGLGALMILPMIIIMGILSAFIIPAVGAIIGNAEKDMIYQDALIIEQAAVIYCSQEDCDDTVELTMSEIRMYVSNFHEPDYEIDNNTIVATGTLGIWHVYLEPVGTGGYEFPNYLVPSESGRDDCVTDTD